jgi:hypothetical protein
LETTDKDILVKARFNAWDAKDAAFLLLSFILLGSGLFFFSSPDLKDISYYPLIGSIPFIIVVLFRILFLGNLHISKNDIYWKTLVGPQRSFSLNDIGFCGFDPKSDEPVLLLTNHEGKKVRRFKEIKPVNAAGAMILYFRYMNQLPALVFELWKPLTKGKRTYEGVSRITRIDGDVVKEEIGFIVLYDNKLMYIPTEPTKPLKAELEQRLKKAGVLADAAAYPPSKHILTHTLVEAVLEANMPLAIRNEHLNNIVRENGGCLITDPARNGKTWQWFNEGVELKIQRP